MREHVMSALVTVHVAVRDVAHRTHIRALNGNVLAELVAEHGYPRGDVRNGDRRGARARLELLPAERVIDIARVDREIGVREERRILRPRVRLLDTRV